MRAREGNKGMSECVFDLKGLPLPRLCGTSATGLSQSHRYNKFRIIRVPRYALSRFLSSSFSKVIFLNVSPATRVQRSQKLSFLRTCFA
jgi:hypothetical protein